MPPSTTAPKPGFFIAGTDTNVGKTLISSAILSAARQAGFRLVPFKPAETGCLNLAQPHDACLLRDAAGRPDLPLDLVCPHRFKPAVAPAATAEPPLRLVNLVDAALRARTLGDGLLVESAGGLLSPYAPTFTGADLAAALGLPVLLIARDDLGTINHSLLCLAEIARRTLPFAGLILVRSRPGRAPSTQRNPELIEALSGTKPLLRIPYFKRATPETIAAALSRRGLGWAALLEKAEPPAASAPSSK